MGRPKKLPQGVRAVKNKSGTVYQAIWTQPATATSKPKQHSATFDDPEEAAVWRAEIRQAVLSGLPAPVRKGSDTTFVAYLEFWAQDRKDNEGISLSTVATDEWTIKHVGSHFGTAKLCQVTADDLTRFFDHLRTGTDLGRTSIEKLATKLRTAFKAAVKRGLLAHNPTPNMVVFPKRRETYEHERARETEPERLSDDHIPAGVKPYLTTRQVMALEAAIDEWWSLYPRFVTDTGLRIGEVAALRVRDIDLQLGRVTVSMSVKATRVKDTGRSQVNGQTKSGKTRSVPTLSPSTVDLIAQLIVDRKLGPDDYLFTGRRGAQMRPGTFRKRVWKAAIKKAKLNEDWTPHVLRHTFASIKLTKEGCSVFLVSQYLGHASVSVTEKVYAHLIEEMTISLCDRPDHWRAASSRRGDLSAVPNEQDDDEPEELRETS